jgi:hypothetical protein
MSKGTAATALNGSPADQGSAPDWFAIRDMLLVESFRAEAGGETRSRSADPALRKSLERHAKYFGSETWRRHRPWLVRGGEYSMLDVALFLDKVYDQCSRDEQEAVDAVYDFMDDCLLDGDFSACDAALLSANPEKLLHSVILSFLIVTQRAKGKLTKSRPIFYDRSFAAVSATKGPDHAKELLGKNR